MIKQFTLFILLLITGKYSFAQSCNCETEFSYIKNFMEKNYAGFSDKKALMTDAGYQKKVTKYIKMSKQPNADESCLLLITQFLDEFNDSHVYVSPEFDATKVDSVYISKRRIVPISDEKIAQLRKSKTYEGIYNFQFDSLQYKIAVVKDKTPLHDYIGILLKSNKPGWKRGMIKFEAKMQNDSLGKGILYVLNQRPKTEYFMFRNNQIGGDWQREGTARAARPSSKYEPVSAKKLTNNTLYIKISTFNGSNAKNIDSIIKVNEEALKTMPNLILDLRNNSGGSDFTFSPLMPYVYTQPIKTYGVDLLSTEANINGWKKYLAIPNLPEDRKQSFINTIKNLENNKGKWVLQSNDRTISDYQKQASPQKIVILIDEGCASTTEQFLLFARESSKVTLMGQNTSGTLDYSNVIQAPFSCMPYTLNYSSSRSRRLDHGQGIDDTGIKPSKYLAPESDWIKQAISFLEQ